MADENLSDNLLRAAAAELHMLNRVTAAREMFSKSYFSLGVVEKATVDQTVVSMVAGIYQSFTPEALASRKAQEPGGFPSLRRNQILGISFQREPGDGHISVARAAAASRD
jgi:hypothetical protein